MKVLPRSLRPTGAAAPAQRALPQRSAPSPSAFSSSQRAAGPVLDAPPGTPVASALELGARPLFPEGLALEVKDAAVGSIGFVAGAAPSRLRERLEANGVTLLAVRHGQSEANALSSKFHEPVLAGQSDAPLTELGRKQAATAAKSLYEELGGETLLREALADPTRLPVIYVSPLQRTSQTASALVELVRTESARLGRRVELTPVVAPELIEIDYGALDLLPLSVFAKAHPALFSSWEAFKGQGVNFSGQFPDGESRLDVLHRQARFLERVAAEHPGRAVICFCHLETMVGLQVATANGSTMPDGTLRVMAAKLPNAAVMHLTGPKAPGLAADA